MGAIISKKRFKKTSSKKVGKPHNLNGINEPLNMRVWTKEEVERNRSSAYKYVV
jgi:hypothetical protein